MVMRGRGDGQKAGEGRDGVERDIMVMIVDV